MVDGSPVFLTCQDQEVLEVAKAVLREKFPQVMNWLLCVILILVLRWRKSVAAKQVVGRLRCVTLPGSKLFSEMRGSCLSLFFTLKVPGSVRSRGRSNALIILHFLWKVLKRIIVCLRVL